MENFDFVRHASKSEVDKFFSDLDKDRIAKYSKSLDILNRYRNSIFEEFENINNNYQKNSAEYPVKKQEFFDMVKNLNQNQKCICGSKLRHIDGLYGAFWGCENYKNDNVKHLNYMDNANPYPPIQPPSVIGWPASIRSRLNLPRSLPTACIYHYLLNNGYEDLSEKYHGRSELNNIYKLVDTRKSATRYELEMFELLKKKLPKISHQFALRYKIQGNKAEKFAFLDLVGSDDSNVYVFECKTNSYDIDPYQRDLYIDLVTFLLKDKNINKPVKFEFLIENN